jgi:hypothetical protein
LLKHAVYIPAICFFLIGTLTTNKYYHEPIQNLNENIIMKFTSKILLKNELNVQNNAQTKKKLFSKYVHTFLHAFRYHLYD